MADVVTESVTTMSSKETPSDLKFLSMNDFDVGKPLGKGAFGTVYLVRLRATQRPYALKTLFKTQIVDANVQKHIANEIKTQGLLDHPHIVKMKTWWQNKEKLFFIFEYCHWNTLFDMIQNTHGLEERHALKLFSQVVDAVNFCHMHNVIHRDIKPENILMWKKDHIKLSDFGWSACFVSGKKNTTVCGTLEYMAPELISALDHTYKVDNWALGVLLFEMIHGGSPFFSDETAKCEKKIMTGRYSVNSNISSSVEKMIEGLITVLPQKRTELKQILHEIRNIL